MAAIISRIEVTSPPGVFSCRMRTAASRLAAVSSASSSCLVLAGPMAPSMATLSATFPLPVEEKGETTAAAKKAAARRATRAKITLKAPW